MNTTMNRSNTDRTNVLARLLATENLRVVHDANMPSAAFDLNTRTLILPMWKCDKVVYDMLVGHEVAHAKYTPSLRWKSAAEEIGGTKHARIAQDFINVVEDARIERLIKREFPGLRADFIAGYKHLHETMDIFKVKGKDIGSMRFIDRINLHYKVGIHCGVTIPFTAEERTFLDRIAATRDGERGFEDVVEIARDLWARECEEREDQQDEQNEGESKSDGKGKPEGKDGKGQAPDANDGNEGQGDADGESTDGSEGDQDGSSGEQGIDADGNDNGSGKAQAGSGEEQQDSGQSMTDDTDDGKSAESRKGETKTEGKSGQRQATSGGSTKAPAEVTTASSMQKGMEKFVDHSSIEQQVVIGTMDHSKVVVTSAEFIALCDKHITKHQYSKFNGNASQLVEECAMKAFKRISDENRRNVDLMVKRFEVKRAARNHARTSSCKTGRISTRHLSKYKFSEDIFDRLTIRNDEKNHGIVILLDWSGSIGSMIGDTVSQLVALLNFCRRAGVPAEVYFFTTTMNKFADELFKQTNPNAKTTRAEVERWGNISNTPGVKWDRNTEAEAFTDHVFNLPSGSAAKGGCPVVFPFSLVRVYEQNMNNKQFARSIGRLILLSQLCGGYYGSNEAAELSVSHELCLGGTPLDESILAMRGIVNDFRKSSNSKVTLINLTDGEGMDIVARGFANQKVNPQTKATNINRVVVDGNTGRRFEFKGTGNAHSNIVQMFKDATDAQIIGIFLTRHNSRYGQFQPLNVGPCSRGYYENPEFMQNDKYGYPRQTAAGQKFVADCQAQWEKDNFIAFSYKPYDMYFTVNIPDRILAEREIKTLEAKAETAKNQKVAQTKAFIASLKADEANRMFINRLMDVIA